MDSDNAHINVLLYSKFSRACNKFLEILEKVPLVEENTTLVCIDNNEVRKRIMHSKKLSIKEVPAFLRVYESNGYVESFEGDKAFAVLNAHYIEYLQHLQAEEAQKKVSPLPPPQQNMQQNIQSQPQNIQSQPQNMMTPIENITEIDSTSMNNMNNNNNALNTYMHIPTTLSQQQSPPSTSLPPVMSSVDRAIKKEAGASGGGSGSIVNLAMQMQKERESEAPARPGMPPMS